MKLNRNMKIENIVSNNKTRGAISNVYLHGEKLIATDGIMMVVATVEKDEGDVDGMVPVAAITEARRIAGKNDPVVISLNGKAKLVNGAEYDRPDGQFPQWTKVAQKHPTASRTMRVGLDPEKLLAIAKALNNGQQLGKTPYLYLEISEETTAAGKTFLHPIVVKRSTDANGCAADDYAVLMPVRID